jgi:hypothetical protein
MAKKFMFVCIGIMALAVTFHMGAQYGSASIVDRSQTGIIACYREAMAAGVLMDSGEIYYVTSLGGWSGGTELPVPASDVKFYDRLVVVTYSDEVWIHDGGHFPEDPWRNLGSPPGGVRTEPSTWGNIKAKFAE